MYLKKSSVVGTLKVIIERGEYFLKLNPGIRDIFPDSVARIDFFSTKLELIDFP
jgi:hypothetical protein